MFGDSQTKTGSAVFARGGTVGLGEGLKQVRQRVGRDTDASVGHSEADGHVRVGLALAGHAKGHFSLFSKLDAVDYQVGDHLAESARVAAQERRHIVVNDGDKLDLFALSAFRQEFDGAFDGAAQVEVQGLELQLASLDFREVKDVVDNCQ